MLKKIIYIVTLGLIGYLLFLPQAIKQTQDSFEAAGVSNASILDFLHTTDDES